MIHLERCLVSGVSEYYYDGVVREIFWSLHGPLRQGAAQTGMRGSSGDIRVPTLCYGSTLAWNARDVGSIPGLGTLFPIFITHTILLAMTMVLYKLHAVWLLNLPCAYM